MTWTPVQYLGPLDVLQHALKMPGLHLPYKEGIQLSKNCTKSTYLDDISPGLHLSTDASEEIRRGWSGINLSGAPPSISDTTTSQTCSRFGRGLFEEGSVCWQCCGTRHIVYLSIL